MIELLREDISQILTARNTSKLKSMEHKRIAFVAFSISHPISEAIAFFES